MNRHRPNRSQPEQRSGIILLVVLSSLTFFSLLVAAYLVFSNQSRQSSFVMAARNARAPDVNGLLNESLMTLIRGTNDPNNPFFGESLLDDYYGRDGITMRLQSIGPPSTMPVNPDPSREGPFELGTGIVRIPVVRNTPGTRPTAPGNPYSRNIDDLYSGRVITFTQGPLADKSYRVLRSRYHPAAGTIAECDDLYIELDGSELALNPSTNQIRSLFYPDLTDFSAGGYQFQLNGVPRNSAGIGYDGNNLNDTVALVTDYQQADPSDPTTTLVGFNTLPVALQPNHIRLPGTTNVDKSNLLTAGGDFDEGYDAPDYLNWFLSHRHSDGTVIPSFHRPSVINYILNEVDWSSTSPAPTGNDYRDAVVSIARATFRPIPIAEDLMRPGATAGTIGSRAINPRFTGGNSQYALRSTLAFRYSNPAPTPNSPGDLRSNARTLLDQLSRALIQGPWDVDNDSDGIPDSVWVDLGLPIFTSQEGKLLKPLIAPMIEDLNGRLNVNVVGNQQLATNVAGSPNNANAFWAGTRNVFGDVANQRRVFRGIGYGPADIMIPASYSYTATGTTPGIITNTNILNDIAALLNDRYRFGNQSLATPDKPGREGADALDVVRTGYRPIRQLSDSGYGMSSDPFGWGGVGAGRSGHVVAADSGTIIVPEDTMTTAIEAINEAVDDPYETDPTGTLSGDLAFTAADLEAILRSDDFDSEMLPQRLRNRVRQLIANYPEYKRSLTTQSASDDSLPLVSSGDNAFVGLVELIESVGSITLSQAQIEQLIAPEIRLGRKLDVNRSIGNGVDDNGNGVIDEPLETLRADNNTDDDDGDGVTDEPGELYNDPSTETEAFRVAASAGSVPTSYQTYDPHYTFDEPNVPGTVASGTFTPAQTNGRQILARHLYVLLSVLTADGVDFVSIDPGNNPLPTAIEAAYKARRLAQWAVNVVDYRDPDSIMTRFPYDDNPLDGWGLAIDDNDDGTPDRFEGNATLATHPTPSPIVWGVEAPELMFTESLAFHDVRVRDTIFDPSGDDRSGMDNDTDQVRVPQGSLFLELYCPHPTASTTDESTKRSFPQELYNSNGELDLGATAPGNSTVSGAPIWRIAISEPHINSPTADPDLVRSNFPDSASFEIEQPDELGNFTDPTLNYDRFIFFGGPRTVAGPTTTGISGNFAALANVNALVANENITDMSGRENGLFFARDIGYNPSAQRLLSPGQYLVLAPRTTTYLGSRSDGSGNPLYPSRQRFERFANGLVHLRNTNGTTNPPTEVRTSPTFGATAFHTIPKTLVVNSFYPATWTAGTKFEHGAVGLNVSAGPHDAYYTEPMFQYNGTVGEPVTPQDNDGFAGVDYPLTDAYLDLSNTATTSAIDTPLDIANPRIPNAGDEPELGTIPSYCSAFLQRLADPTLPHNPITNPYRTVDWIQIDLTVFSGEARPGADMGQGGARYTTRSRQRTGRPASGGQDVLYSYAVNDVDLTPGNMLTVADASLTDLDFFNIQHPSPTNPERYIFSSLGFLNTPTYTKNQYILAAVGDEVDNGHSNPAFIGYSASIGRLGSPTADNVVGNDRNLPQTPFALHPWLNRPFSSQLELLMVPACSQGRLFEEFTVNTGGDPDIYPEAATPSADPTVFNSPFRHLLNFFHSSYDNAGSSATRYNDATQVTRLLDFVHTLPRFRGEVEMIDPGRLTSTVAAEETELALLRTLLMPPFNFRYDNTRQGTINLNSLAEFPVWAGLMQGHMNPDEFNNSNTASQLAFDQFIANRRGYGAGTLTTVSGGAAPNYNYEPTKLDPRFPTQFAGAYKGAIDTPFSPELRTAADTDLLRRRGANGTLLRGAGTLDANDPPGGPPIQSSLFVRDSTQTPMTLHQDRNRNPFLRYQTLMRMPNLVSDNSQTFLIRMTMGFFEVDANDIASVGQEYNASIGQNNRYRATFMVDRSIPVGFVAGQNLNARDIVIYESYDQ
tara:strand:- start:4596 stop:10427 length:5832 start_codon:yes stop_codon:yes gene_type:complete